MNEKRVGRSVDVGVEDEKGESGSSSRSIRLLADDGGNWTGKAT